MSSKIRIRYARLWPREIFGLAQSRRLMKTDPSFDVLKGPGVYVLYRNDVPYYLGKADKLRHRLRRHAITRDGDHYHFWNFFSVFSIEDKQRRDEIEGILIAAMPTANGAKPRLQKVRFPRAAAKGLEERR